MSRPIPNVSLGGYRPNQVKINSIGIGIDDETLDSLNLDSSQYMVVGGQTNDIYNLIVDSEGLIVNSSIINRAAHSNEYALFVDGNIFVTGKVDTSAGTLSNIAGGGSGSACNFWMPVRRDVPSSTNIFYDGKINIANESQSRSNTYRVNIVDNANRTINNAQFAIQNQVGSVARVGILGYSNLSPVIVNSAKGPIEFHANRDESYFNSVYYRSNMITHTTDALNIPYYACNEIAPHLCINRDGTVGIKATPNNPLNYTLRTVDSIDPHIIQPTIVANKPADLQINGTTYSCNILIYDYESKQATNIDDLYVRKLGVTLAASQVAPGSFAPGYYTFLSNVSIGGQIEPEYNLTVYGKMHITDHLDVDKAILSSNLVIKNTFEVLGTSYFENDVIVNDNLQVNDNLIVWGAFYADSNALYTFVPGNTSNEIANVQFIQYIANGWSNIYMQGAGFVTPGQVGIGINVENINDSVDSQLSVISRNENIFALSLSDKTNGNIIKSLFVGHQRNNIVNELPDPSVIFTTPSSMDPYFNFIGFPAPQNIYFYPGQYDKTIEGQNTVRDGNPPILGIYESKQVSVNSFKPDFAAEFYVNGSIAYSSNLYKYNQLNSTLIQLGEFRYGSTIGDETQKGISYFDINAPHVGINIPPYSEYGLSVNGGIYTDTYYTKNGEKGYLWLDSSSYSGIQEPTTTDGMFVISKVGIGNVIPQYVLDIYSDNSEINNNNGTYIRLKKSSLEGMSNTGIRFDGAINPWFVNMESISPAISSFAIGSSSSVYDLINITSNNGLTIQYNALYGNNGHQVIIGGNTLLISDNINNINPIPNAILTVNGDTSIIGNLNVTGIITANNTVTPVSSDRSNIPSIQQDDLFISGKDIYVNPTNKMYINYTCNLLDYSAEKTNQAVLNVYQDINNNANGSPIAHFISKSDNAFIEIVSESIQQLGGINDGVLRIGLLTGDVNKQIIGIQDSLGYNYMSFKKSGNTQRSMGINTDNPNAQLHIVNDEITLNKQMLRISYNNGNGGDTTNFSPNMILEKIYNDNDNNSSVNKQWFVQGPVYGTGNDALQFKYVKTVTDPFGNQTTASNIVLTLTSNGCIGINNTTPKYLIDVVTSNIADNHGLRLWNKINNDAAQLIFQSGESPEIGGDIYTDYIMYSCNNNFIFNQRDINTYTTTPLLYFNSSAKLGINTSPNNDYNVNISGKINILEGIYINGKKLASATDFSISGYTIYGSNSIFMIPDVINKGGIVVNNTLPTNNLFHIFNDNTDSANMMVYDSILPNAEIYFRNKKHDDNIYNLYKIYTSNNHFGISYQETTDRAFTLPTSEWKTAWDINAVSSTGYLEHDATLNGNLMLYSSIRGTPKVQFGTNGEMGGNNTYGSLYINTSPSSNIGIGTTIPTAPFHVHRNVSMGNGLAGSNASMVGGPFFKQSSWNIAGTTHLISYPDYCIGDNSTGTLQIQITNKSTNPSIIKLANMQVSFIKPFDQNVIVSEISSHKNTEMTFYATASYSNIVLTTDNDCSISWTSIGSY